MEAKKEYDQSDDDEEKVDAPHVEAKIELDEDPDSGTRQILENAVLRNLEGRAFKSLNINKWVNLINDESLSNLLKSSDDYKYLVSTIIMEREHGAGLSYKTNMYWSPDTDNACTVTWHNDTIECIVTAFTMAL